MEKSFNKTEFFNIRFTRKYNLHNKKIAIEHNGKIITNNQYRKNLKK